FCRIGVSRKADKIDNGHFAERSRESLCDLIELLFVNRGLTKLFQPAVDVVEYVACGYAETHERNVGGRAVWTFHEETCLSHLRKRLRLPIRRSWNKRGRCGRRHST